MIFVGKYARTAFFYFSPMQALVPIFHSANEIVQTSSLFKRHRHGYDSLDFGRNGLTQTCCFKRLESTGVHSWRIMLDDVPRPPKEHHRRRTEKLFGMTKLFAVKLCSCCEMLGSIIVVVRELVCDLDLRQ